MIPYSTQSIDDDDIQAVVNALKSEYITQGSKVEEFERAIARYTGARFAIVFNSATSALDIAYKILNLEGEYALTTPLSFCATSNMMLNNGIKPVFCDIYSNGNISIDSLKSHLHIKPKAIVSVDYAGNSVSVDSILELCKKHNLYFISDSSHSFGGEYQGKKIGQFADMTIFSFHALKPITTIEGGAITTNNEEFYLKAKAYKSHNLIKKKLWNSELEMVGYNYRLSDVACVLGLSQLKKLDMFIQRRQNIARFYDEIFANNPLLSTITIPQYIKSTHHLYPILLSPKLWCAKEEIFGDLLALGIGVQVHYKPIYQFNLYKYTHPSITNVDNFYKSEISIPCHQKMTQDEAMYVAKSVIATLQKYH